MGEIFFCVRLQSLKPDSLRDPKALRHFSLSTCYDFFSYMLPLPTPLQTHWPPCLTHTKHGSYLRAFALAGLLPETLLQDAGVVLPYAQLFAQMSPQGGLF